jgi:uroporphyrinogen-III synthase
MAKYKVLSTKKLHPSLVIKAKEQDIAVVEQEAIQVYPILNKEKWDEIFSLLEKRIEYAIFTSSNAVAALKKYINTYVSHLPAQWKIFCLSGRTKELLAEDEDIFGTIEGTAINASELAELITGKGVKEVLFFCGNKRRDELPSILTTAGVQVHEVVVYETVETPVNTADDVDAILFFSPSAVQSFFTANQPKDSTVCFAIGKTTADSIAGYTKNKIYTSEAPSQEALLNEVFAYFRDHIGSHSD